jgi:hypothetical protein
MLAEEPVRKVDHDSTCGNKKWFDPLATVHHAELGVAVENAFTGAALGTRWSDPNKRSAFFGTFADQFLCHRAQLIFLTQMFRTETLVVASISMPNMPG